eukprot:TRINITY_DN13939_c0_g1_i1.p1 TRINITY_DN13939_c0_g1~~TRINITY_DN13939_c0_g1_i1.p1  ORF type:complete len:1519 (+),score=565.95 TRINITY_DN13939_c0_g1_i1:81-4559(+)
MVHAHDPAGTMQPPTQYKGMSLREVYCNNCASLGVKPNSRLLRELGAEGGPSAGFSTSLDVSRNFLGERGFQAFVEVVRLSTRLERLVLVDNGLTNDATVALCRVAAEHPALRSIDLSGNYISLTGGQALLDLCRRNVRLVQIELARTNVDERLLHRISRALDHNKVLARKPEPQGETPFQKIKREHQERRAQRHHQGPRESEEDELFNTIAKVLARRQVKAPRRARGGWVILNVFISSTEPDFISEQRAIHHRIVPRLNERLRGRKVLLHPVSLYHDDSPGAKRTGKPRRRSKAAMYHAAAALELVRRCRPVFCMLLGECHGPVPAALPPAPCYEELARSLVDPAQTPQAVLEALHGGLLEERAAALFFIRRASQRLKVPEGIAESVTDNYRYKFPDPEGHISLAAVEPKDEVHRRNPVLMTNRWEQLVRLRQRLATEVPKAMLLPSYDACFSSVGEQGQVLLSGLEGFETEFEERLWQVADYLYPSPPQPEGPDDPTGAEWKELDLREHLRERFISSAAAPLFGRKNTLGKADLYVVSPASRNMLLLHGKRGAGMSALLANFVARAVRRGAYEVAYHFVGNSGLSDECCDLRTTLLSLCKQLLPERRLPPHIQNEVALGPIKEFWKQTLGKATASLREGRILLLAIDSLDLLEAPVEPPEELVLTDTGTNILDPRGVEKKVAGAKAADPFDWIPICLPKSVRLVGSCLTESRAFEILSRRGQDSCEPLDVPALGNADIEGMIEQRLQAQGITLRQDEMSELLSKQDAAWPRYVQLLCDRIKVRWDRGAPQEGHRMAFLRALPGTLTQLVDDTFGALEEACGVPLVSKALGALALCPDGLLDLQLREFLHSAAGSGGGGAAAGGGGAPPLLCGHVWALFKHHADPLLTSPLAGAHTDEMPAEPLNGTDCQIQIACDGVRQAALKRYMPTEEDRRRAHLALAHYLRHTAERGDHPLTHLGVKDFPRMMVAAGMWSALTSVVFSVRFLRQAFEHSMGYCLFRDMVRAYALMKAASDSQHESLKPFTSEVVFGWLHKMREYVHFVHANLQSLASRPRLAIQQGLSAPSGSTIYGEARSYYAQHPGETYFLWLNKDQRKMHKDAVNSAVFAPNGLRVLTGSADRSITLCNVVGDVVHHIGTSAGVRAALLSRTSRYVVAALEDRSLSVHDAATGMPVTKLLGHTGPIKCCDISARGRFVFSGGEDRCLRCWESETGRCVTEIPHSSFCPSSSPYSAVSAVAAHPLDEGLLLSAVDRFALLWRINPDFSHSLVHQLTVHAQWPTTAVLWRGDGDHIITAARRSNAAGAVVATRDTPLKIWCSTTGQLLARLGGAQEETLCRVEISQCAKVVGAAGEDGSVFVWSLSSALGRQAGAKAAGATKGEDAPVVPPSLVVPSAHSPSCALIAFSHDSRFVATAGPDCLLRVWAVAEGQLLAEYVVDAKPRSLCYTPCPTAGAAELVVGDQAGHVYFLTCHNFRAPKSAGEDPAASPPAGAA